jgi:hypothetical protein
LIGRSPVQALANEPSPIPAQYFGFTGLFGAFGQLDLLSASLFGDLAKFGRDTCSDQQAFQQSWHQATEQQSATHRRKAPI